MIKIVSYGIAIIFFILLLGLAYVYVHNFKLYKNYDLCLSKIDAYHDLKDKIEKGTSREEIEQYIKENGWNGYVDKNRELFVREKNIGFMFTDDDKFVRFLPWGCQKNGNVIYWK